MENFWTGPVEIVHSNGRYTLKGGGYSGTSTISYGTTVTGSIGLGAA